MSFVTVKVPKAPQPLACMRRSGITSRSKCASFSMSQISCSSAGPRGPAVMMLVLSATGAPVALVNLMADMLGSRICVSICVEGRGNAAARQLLQADPRITLQKLPRLKVGSLSASTSALTLPNVVAGFFCRRKMLDEVTGVDIDRHI